MQIGAKYCKDVHALCIIFQLSFHFAYHRWWSSFDSKITAVLFLYLLLKSSIPIDASPRRRKKRRRPQSKRPKEEEEGDDLEILRRPTTLPPLPPSPPPRPPPRPPPPPHRDKIESPRASSKKIVGIKHFKKSCSGCTLSYTISRFSVR